MGRKVVTPNTQLVQARCACPSRVRPGHHMSRSELARAANELLHSRQVLDADVDASYISKLEAGEYRWPRSDHRRWALRTALEVATDEELGFYPTRSTGLDGPTLISRVPGQIARDTVQTLAAEETREDEQMRRRTLLTALFAAPLADSSLAGDTDPRVGRLERSAASLRSLYHRSGSAQELLDLAVGHLDATTDLIRRLPEGSLRERVLRSRSEVGTLAGRISFFDLNQYTIARGFYLLAYEGAQAAHDDALAAAALGHLAFVPSREGSPEAAADYLASAERHAAAADVSAVRSWVHAVESELLVEGDVSAGMRALDQARAVLPAPGAPPPAWFDYYSPARLAGFSGYALLRSGQPEQARHALERALTELGAGAVKQRAVFLFDVADTHVVGKSPDVEAACVVAHAGLDALLEVGYATALDRLRTFRSRLEPWDDHPDVRAFDERLVAPTA